MSGEITITPGKTWASPETVTYDKLNQTAQPTGRVDEDAITSREIDTSELLSAIGDALKGYNYFKNPILLSRSWQETGSSGVVAADGKRIYNALNWFALCTGAAGEYSRVEEAPAASVKNKYAAKLKGNTSVTTFDFGQYISPDMAEQMSEDTITVSFYIKNETSGSLTPQLRINVSDAVADQDATTNAHASNMTALASGAGWTRIDETVDLSALSNLERGFEVVVRMPSGTMDSNTKVVKLTQFQLEKADAVTGFYVPPDAKEKKDNLYASGDPTVDDDTLQGYTIGSQWIVGNSLYFCTDASEGAAVWTSTTQSFEFVIVADEKVEGSEGGTFTQGAWRTRDLNTIKVDDTAAVALASNRVSLPAGTWVADIRVPAFKVDDNRARLYNYTDSTEVALSQSMRSQQTGSDNNILHLLTKFTIASAKEFEIQHQCNNTQADNGFGNDDGITAGVETFTLAMFTRVST